MAEINWTDQAIEDIDNIAQFIAQDSPGFARIQVQRFFTRVEILKTQPKLGRMVPEIEEDQLRELIQGNYRIIYKIVDANLIDILTIHHSRRLLKNNPSIGEGA